MNDYKSTPEGLEALKKYGDILHLSRLNTEDSRRKHPRMSLENRAKIFSPFAALRGYEDKIAHEDWKKDRIPMPILSEGEQEALSAKLVQLTKGQTVSVSYFVPDEIDSFGMPKGVIHTLTGPLEKIDLIFQNIRHEGRVIPFDLILDVADELLG